MPVFTPKRREEISLILRQFLQSSYTEFHIQFNSEDYSDGVTINIKVRGQSLEEKLRNALEDLEKDCEVYQNINPKTLEFNFGSSNWTWCF